MIEYIKGLLVEKAPTYAVVECAGVGYVANISLYTYSALADTEQQVCLYIHTIIREDSHQLFGFFSKEERDIFRKLISVSGVGAGTARTILSSMDLVDVLRVISNEDVAALKRVKGLGLKTAQRIILELKGKIDATMIAGAESAEGGNAVNSVRTEALDALEVLGFVRKNCEKYVDEILIALPTVTVENLIKMTLKAM